MIVKLLTDHNLEFLSSKGGCRGSSESTLVKMSNCWKSHALAQFAKFSILRLTCYGILNSGLILKTFTQDNVTVCTI